MDGKWEGVAVPLGLGVGCPWTATKMETSAVAEHLQSQVKGDNLSERSAVSLMLGLLAAVLRV